jgi:hypothetical protein
MQKIEAVPWSLFFVLQDESGQTVIDALYEKDAENYEEDALIKQARCDKKLEKRRKMPCLEGLEKGQNGAA